MCQDAFVSGGVLPVQYKYATFLKGLSFSCAPLDQEHCRVGGWIQRGQLRVPFTLSHTRSCPTFCWQQWSSLWMTALPRLLLLSVPGTGEEKWSLGKSAASTVSLVSI